jgi:hypothetical protein
LYSSIFGGPPLLVTLRRYNIWMPWDLLKMDDIVTIYNYLRNEHPDDVVPRLKFLISNFCCVLNVICFLLGNSLASEFGRRGITQKKAYNKVNLLALEFYI